MSDNDVEKTIESPENRIEYVREDFVFDPGDELDGKELNDGELAAVVGGGACVGGSITLQKASLYGDSYGSQYWGSISGTYDIQRIISGRPCPYLLSYNVGWVKDNKRVIAINGVPVNGD